MSHAPAILHASEVHAAAPRAQSAYGLLSAATAAAILASLVMATVLSRSPAAAQVHQAPMLPATSVVTVTSPGSSVPEASAVFAGKDVPIVEPAPTF